MKTRTTRGVIVYADALELHIAVASIAGRGHMARQRDGKRGEESILTRHHSQYHAHRRRPPKTLHLMKSQ